MTEKKDPLEKIWFTAENVVTRKIADETILVPISGDLANMQRIFTLNEVGAFIWDLIDGKKTAKEIQQELLLEFDVDESRLTDDMRDYIGHLKQSELILEK